MPEIKEQIKNALETYNKFAKVYADYTFQKIPQFQLNRFISLLKGKKILDAGCGAGRDVQYFLDENLEPLGIDISPALLKEAKTRVNGNFQFMDFTELQFPESEFDGIWCIASMSDVDDEDSKKALAEFSRVLKQEGILFISVREGHGQEFISSPRYENNPRYYNNYTKEKLQQLLENAKFQIISCTVCEDESRNWIEALARKL